MFILRKYSQFPFPRQVKIIFISLLCCLLLCYFKSIAIENNGRGTKAIGMGNAFVAVSDNVWALNYNPAGLAQLSNIQFSAFMIPAQFDLPELRTTAIAITIPLSSINAGLKIEKFGFELYSESEIGVGASVNIEESVALGLAINYRRVEIANYGNSNKIILDAGILAHVADNITTGFSIHNMLNTTIGRMKEYLPKVFSIGTCWKAINTLKLSIEIEKDVRYPENIKFGIEQCIFDVISIYGGIGNNPDKYSMGIGIRYSYFEFSYAGYSHFELGWTHQIEISFKLDD